METLSLFKRQEYIDVDNPEHARKLGYTHYQIKYDGIWARLEIVDGVGFIYSRNGQIKKTFTTSMPNMVLIGEFMFGTNWSTHPDRAGKFYVFDIESFGKDSYMGHSYDLRFRAIVEYQPHFDSFIKPVGLARIEAADLAYERIDSGSADYEGLVFRKLGDLPTSTLARWKRKITDDVVVMDKYEGKGRLAGTLGGLIVGKFNNGVLTPLYKVGGGIDDLLRYHIWHHWNYWYLTVIECKGNARFDSGALRHPNFSRIRPDKQPSECVVVPNES